MIVMIVFILVYFLGCGAHATEVRQPGLWQRICERFITDDPYQYESLTVDQLVKEYFYLANHKSSTEAVVHEMGKRLKKAATDEDRIVINSCLANERRQ